jgi:hypothetical protein
MLDEISLYPVPSTGEVILENIPVPVTMEVYSLIGERVWESRMTQTHCRLDFGSLNQGMYFIRFVEPDLGISVIKKMIIN